jgi:hypothetical protein
MRPIQKMQSVKSRFNSHKQTKMSFNTLEPTADSKYDVTKIVANEVTRIQNHQKMTSNLESKFKSDLKKF